MDHATISVSQLEQSIVFYGRLGFSVGTRQTNRGPEQALLDGLDGLDGVEIEVVALIPGRSECFHIELLACRSRLPSA